MEDYGGALHKPYPVCRPEGSVAATQHPSKEIRKSRPRKFVTHQKVDDPRKSEPRTRHTPPHITPPNKRKHTNGPNARGPWVTPHRAPPPPLSPLPPLSSISKKLKNSRCASVRPAFFPLLPLLPLLPNNTTFFRCFPKLP